MYTYIPNKATSECKALWEEPEQAPVVVSVIHALNSKQNDKRKWLSDEVIVRKMMITNKETRESISFFILQEPSLRFFSYLFVMA